MKPLPSPPSRVGQIYVPPASSNSIRVEIQVGAQEQGESVQTILQNHRTEVMRHLPPRSQLYGFKSVSNGKGYTISNIIDMLITCITGLNIWFDIFILPNIIIMKDKFEVSTNSSNDNHF